MHNNSGAAVCGQTSGTKSVVSNDTVAPVMVLAILVLLGAGCAGEMTTPAPPETEAVVVPPPTLSVTTAIATAFASPPTTPLVTASATRTLSHPTSSSLSPAPESLTPGTATPSAVLTEPVDRPTLAPTDRAVPYLALPLYTPLMSPPPGHPDVPLVGVTSLAVSAGYSASPQLAAGTDGSGVLFSTDGGGEWHWRSYGLPEDVAITQLAVAAGDLAAVTSIGAAYWSRQADEQWEPFAGLQEGVERIDFSPSYQEDGTVYAVQHGALLRSADRGESWTAVLSFNGCPVNIAFSPYYAVDRTAFAPRCDHLVQSTDGGVSWTDVPALGTGLEAGHLTNLQALSSMLLAQGAHQGMPVYSEDGGRTWQRAFDASHAPFTLGTLWNIASTISGNAIYAAGRSHVYDSETTVWRTEDRGLSWQVVARTAGVAHLVALDANGVWLAAADGIYRDGGDGWRLVHPGGSRPELAGAPSESVAVVRRGISKYTFRMWLYEKRGQWQPVYTETTDKAVLRAFPSPMYADEQLVVILGQDYGGSVWAMALRLQAEEPLALIDQIPSGPGDSVGQYDVRYADDYASSGRIELRHGHTGALYISDDRGYTWYRPDPAEPGACVRNPVSGFGVLWFGNDDVRGRLLCPLDDEQPYSGTVQPYERGELLLLESEALAGCRLIYALLPNWLGEPAWGTMPHYESSEAHLQAPDGLLAPDSVFTTAWAQGFCCRPNSLPAAEALGWATDVASGIEAAVQHFEGGTLIWRGDRDEIVFLQQLPERDVYSTWPD